MHKTLHVKEYDFIFKFLTSLDLSFPYHYHIANLNLESAVNKWPKRVRGYVKHLLRNIYKNYR